MSTCHYSFTTKQSTWLQQNSCFYWNTKCFLTLSWCSSVGVSWRRSSLKTLACVSAALWKNRQLCQNSEVLIPNSFFGWMWLHMNVAYCILMTLITQTHCTLASGSKKGRTLYPGALKRREAKIMGLWCSAECKQNIPENWVPVVSNRLFPRYGHWKTEDKSHIIQQLLQP